MDAQHTLTVLGAGYVGLTTATLFAHAGYKVYVIEPNPKRLEVILSGKSFFYEEGLDALIKLAIDAGTLLPTASYEASVPQSSIVFSCVGTPDNPDGSSNLSYVFSAAQEALTHMNDNVLYIQKSTVPVGTGEKIEHLFSASGKQINYVSNPEFLREGTALADTLYFDRVVAGSENSAASEQVLALYRRLEASRNSIAAKAGITSGQSSDQYISTNRNSAELIKVTANAFLALKISFANSIAMLADETNADINEVMDAVGADNRIGRSFLDAGRGYGGGCFPKDVSGLISSAKEYGVSMDIMIAAQILNDSMSDYVIKKTKQLIDFSSQDVTIAVIGLSFKAKTSDVRKSPGIKIANKLATLGSTVVVYDPEAMEESVDQLSPAIKPAQSLQDALSVADAAICATDWSEFTTKNAAYYAQYMKGKVFIDAVNKFEKEQFLNEGFVYTGIGR